MNLTNTVSIPPQVMARTVGEETVLLDLASGTYFGLDPVGTRIWQLISEGKTVAAVCDNMLAEFDVSRDTLEPDVMHLLDELRDKGLVNAA